jgi:hypothetical protein
LGLGNPRDRVIVLGGPPCTTRGVSHCGLPIHIKKYLNAEEELWKFKYFTMQIIYNLQINPLKRNQNPSRYYYNSITNLKFQHKPKYHLSKILV